MSIEPHHARTVCIRSPIPPKPAPVTLAPRVSMAEDAKLIRERARRTWGFTTASASGSDTNEKRSAAAKQRCDALARQIMAMLASGPATSAEIREATRETENLVAKALRQLRGQGLVRSVRRGHTAVWIIIEGRQG